MDSRQSQITYKDLLDKLSKFSPEQLELPVKLRDTMYGSSLSIKEIAITESDDGRLVKGHPFITF